MTGTACRVQLWTKPDFAGSTAGHPQASATSQSRLSAESITEIRDASSMSSATASCSASRVRSPRHTVESQQLCREPIVFRFDGRPDDQAVPRNVCAEASQGEGAPVLIKGTGSDLKLQTPIPSRPTTDEIRCLSIRAG